MYTNDAKTVSKRKKKRLQKKARDERWVKELARLGIQVFQWEGVLAASSTMVGAGGLGPYVHVFPGKC